jgi:VanZ family protein
VPSRRAAPRLRRIGAALAVLSVTALAIFTLLPVAAMRPVPRPWCLRCGALGGVDFALNVLAFVPLGFGLRLAGLSRVRALVMVVATTLAIELLQLYIPGRVTSLGDLISNSIGGALGIAIGEWGAAIVLPSPRAARRLAVAAVAAVYAGRFRAANRGGGTVQLASGAMCSHGGGLPCCV